jgi:hypothetical protein
MRFPDAGVGLNPGAVCVRLPRVYLLFLDESGKPDDRSFALGGVAVRAERWHELRDIWQPTLSANGWPLDKEAKWHGIRNGEVPPDLADALFSSLTAAPVTCFVVVLRPLAGRGDERLRRFFEDDEATYTTALMFVAERFQRFLHEQDSYGAIVLDSRQREVDDRMRRFFERMQEEGTPFTGLERIVDSLLLGPSHYSIGLQVADLVVASALEGRRHLGDASRWHKALLPLFASHPATGEIDGVGIKEFPLKARGEEPPPVKLFEMR